MHSVRALNRCLCIDLLAFRMDELRAWRQPCAIAHSHLDSNRVPLSIQDDFYLNLVDWSQQNVLTVGLGKSVYLWSACTSQV